MSLTWIDDDTASVMLWHEIMDVLMCNECKCSGGVVFR